MAYGKRIVVLLLIAALAGCGFWNSVVQEEKTSQTTEARQTAAPAPQSIDVKDAESMIIVFVVPPDKVKGLVPEPLILNPYNIMYVAVSRTPMGAGFVHSMELGISVTFKGRVYSYPVYRLVDNKSLSEVGRITTGAPTPMGEITLTKNGQTLKASARRNGKALFKATMSLGEEGEALDNMPVISLKTITDEENGAPLLKQLVGRKVGNVKVHELIDGECRLEFVPSPADGFPEVPVQQIFRSFYRKADFTLTSAGVLYDYLKKN